jgi:Histidine kinase.
MIAEGAALFPLDRMDALWCGFILLFYSTAILANSAHTEMTRFREMYEALKGDYRRLKRYARLTEEEARNEERTKIARDIHDSVGHKLTALLMQMELASLKYGKEAFAPLKKLAKESLEETRAAVKALKAEEVEGISTILQLIKKLESESHIHVHFTTKQGILSTKLTNEESVVLYRVIQEGLTNAMRHAHVREVHVELGRTAVGHIEFQIKNRIPRKTVFSEGFGIRNIRERVEKLGGELYAYQTETHFHLKGHFPPANGVKGRVEPVNC